MRKEWLETDYYAVPSASPLVRLHLGRPLLAWVENMTALYSEMPQSARRELVSNMDKIVAALAPYGARKLPAGFKHRPYLLPGGTKMTICDYTVVDRPTDRWDHQVRVKIDFEPATPVKGREQHPFFVRWRVADRKRGGPAGTIGVLGQSEAGAAAPATGKEAARKWSDRPDGFAAVDAMGQNGTTGVRSSQSPSVSLTTSARSGRGVALHTRPINVVFSTMAGVTGVAATAASSFTVKSPWSSPVLSA